jgi:histidine triad (HIT) family protein
MADRFCEFCKIVRNEVPASCIYEDERVVTFLDIRPLNEGHTLVIPKKHYETIYNVPDEEIEHLFKIVRRVAVAVKKAVNAEGITISQHNEKAAGQDIFHLHVHIIPRYEGQKLPRYEEVPEASREKLDAVAEKIRRHV